MNKFYNYKFVFNLRSVIAQQASARSGLRSLVIDKRDHIG